jgi:hypothetical protein
MRRKMHKQKGKHRGIKGSYQIIKPYRKVDSTQGLNTEVIPLLSVVRHPHLTIGKNRVPTTTPPEM